ncbi:unnamed protein product [Pleuronectes platessa]|uniref:LRRC8 pannexin-like TM region domain-containing protein n=1 Tax=Pleuronectes platessa TaxID=8262 RepID=A0A9N7ZBW4_PLEPL|nr:unnamed protein product [Pleuronectes platessa]
MFTLTEVASLNDIQPTYRILKPWWDVFMDYLGLVMLMLAIFAMTMQITKDQVACLPCLEDPDETPGAKPGSFPQQPAQVTASTASTGAPVASTLPYISKDLPDEAVHEIHTTQQHTAGLSESYPNQPQPTGIKPIWTINSISSSTKYVTTLPCPGRCFESPWTTKALSETACEDSEENKQRLTGTSSVPKRVSLEGKDESVTSSTPMLGVKFSADKPIAEVPSSMTILDKKDGEQAKALFEKVRKFRAHVEDSDFIYKLYVAQTIVKTVKFILILSYTSTFMAKINFKHQCEPDIKQLTGYTLFYCTHNMAFMLNKLLISYMALILIYGMACLYSLFWVFRRPLKEYSFEKVREESSFSDIPDVKNDFAFLLHMVDQYDQLYSKRFGVFLSEVSENKLREISLNHEWTFEKLRQLVSRNTQDQQELHLFMISGLPNAVFDLTDLEVLKLELIPEVRFTAKVSQMTSLQELHLCHCPAKVEQTGFAFLRDHLRCLHVKFTDVAEIPAWVLKKMTNLIELELHSCEIERIPHAIFSLTNLQELDLKSNNIRTIEEIISFQHIKRLTCLKLWHNKIITIPSSIVQVKSLESLHLSHNKLESLPPALFVLPKLRHLDVSHNSISVLPPDVGLLHNLQHLAINSNKLEVLPKPLFRCTKLKVLCLGQNALTVLPETVGQLVQLTQLELRGNCLDRLPALLGNCRLLRKNGLVVEDHLFDTLPVEVKESISRETNVSFTSGL